MVRENMGTMRCNLEERKKQPALTLCSLNFSNTTQEKTYEHATFNMHQLSPHDDYLTLTPVPLVRSA